MWVMLRSVSVDQAEDFLAIGTQSFGQGNLLSQMVEHQERTVEFDLVHFDFGKGSGQKSLTIGFTTHITNMALDTLTIDPPILDFRQIHVVLTLDPADEAHSVHSIH